MLSFRFGSMCTGMIVLAVIVGAAATASAQGGPRYRGYGGRYSSPYGPTLSPYLDYFRRDSGVLDPYNAFVRPRRQLQNDINNIVAQGQAENVRLQREITQLKGVRDPGAAATGTSATYFNYSHYYSMPPGGARRR